MATRRVRDEHHAGTDAYAGMMRRMTRAFGNRARQGMVTLDTLDQMVEIQALLDEQLHEVVHALRSEAGGSHSWAEIGGALGITRAGAANRFGPAPTDARTVGGQPARLR